MEASAAGARGPYRYMSLNHGYLRETFVKPSFASMVNYTPYNGSIAR